MRVFLLSAAAAILFGAAASTACAAADGWVRPVGGAVLRAFSVGPDRFAAGQHRGVDIGAPSGARVRAACGGRVSFAGTVPRGGRTVSVRCGRLVATYQHLGVVRVRHGQIVLPAATIGTVGRARPRPHVHLGARDAATGAYVDPLALITDAREAPPTLPSARVRPHPLGRAPRPSPLARRPAPLELPAAHPAAVRSHADRLPWPVWLGLALFGFGLPLGAVVTTGTRRRRARAPLLQRAS